MKNQDEEFISKRDPVRKALNIKSLKLKGHTYQKVMGQKNNGKYNGPLNDSEVSDLDLSLANTQKIIQEFRDELKR